jgi:hypothetical protein
VPPEDCPLRGLHGANTCRQLRERIHICNLIVFHARRTAAAVYALWLFTSGFFSLITNSCPPWVSEIAVDTPFRGCGTAPDI